MSTRRKLLLAGFIAVAAAVAGMPIPAGAGVLEQQLVGTWTAVATDTASPDGKGHSEPASGTLVFTSDGRFAQIEVVPVTSKNGSLSRVRGLEDGDGATAKASVSVFGTYTVNEDTRTVICYVQSSTMPDWDGTVQQRQIELLTADELRLAAPGGSAQKAAATGIWKRARDGIAIVAVPAPDTAR